MAVHLHTYCRVLVPNSNDVGPEVKVWWFISKKYLKNGFSYVLQGTQKEGEKSSNGRVEEMALHLRALFFFGVKELEKVT